MRSLVPYVDIMKISDEETKLLTDKESPEEATEILFRKGVKIVAVTPVSYTHLDVYKRQEWT